MYTEYNKNTQKKKLKANTEKTESNFKKIIIIKYTNSYKAHNKTLVHHCNKINEKALRGDANTASWL